MTHAHLRGLATAAFRASTGIRLGAEVEWLVYHRDNLARPVPAALTAETAAGPLPRGGTVTVEPGGQLELSTAPFDGPQQLLSAMADDTAVLLERFTGAGLLLVNLGLDPFRPPHRTLQLPRYEAMDRFFSVHSPAGLRMMTLTASLQLNIDFGSDPAQTWRRATRLAPVLCAAFANSPTSDGKSFSPVSLRQNIWVQTDPSRTAPAPESPDAWLAYAMDARVMMRHATDGVVPELGSVSMREWLESPHPPSNAEIQRHVTTLFPPLRPRGFLEIRMLDALPRQGRAAAIATVWALLTSDDAGQQAEHLCAGHQDLWDRVLRDGLADPVVLDLAQRCLAIAAASADASSPQLAEVVRSWSSQRLGATMPAPASAEALVTSLVERPTPEH